MSLEAWDSDCHSRGSLIKSFCQGIVCLWSLWIWFRHVLTILRDFRINLSFLGLSRLAVSWLIDRLFGALLLLISFGKLAWCLHAAFGRVSVLNKVRTGSRDLPLRSIPRVSQHRVCLLCNWPKIVIIIVVEVALPDQKVDVGISLFPQIARTRGWWLIVIASWLIVSHLTLIVLVLVLARALVQTLMLRLVVFVLLVDVEEIRKEEFSSLVFFASRILWWCP